MTEAAVKRHLVRIDTGFRKECDAGYGSGQSREAATSDQHLPHRSTHPVV
jgi:hypothetical protein